MKWITLLLSIIYTQTNAQGISQWRTDRIDFRFNDSLKESKWIPIDSMSRYLVVMDLDRLKIDIYENPKNTIFLTSPRRVADGFEIYDGVDSKNLKVEVNIVLQKDVKGMCLLYKHETVCYRLTSAD